MNSTSEVASFGISVGTEEQSIVHCAISCVGDSNTDTWMSLNTWAFVDFASIVYIPTCPLEATVIKVS